LGSRQTGLIGLTPGSDQGAHRGKAGSRGQMAREKLGMIEASTPDVSAPSGDPNDRFSLRSGARQLARHARDKWSHR
jgi:hypothetical protein